MAERSRLLRRAGWASLLALLALSSLSMLAFLWPPSVKVQPGVVSPKEQIDYRTGVREPTRARLVQQGSEWIGAMADFPPGTLTHFQPQASPGFFLVRPADGTWRAIAERTPYLGLRLKWLVLPNQYF